MSLCYFPDRGLNRARLCVRAGGLHQDGSASLSYAEQSLLPTPPALQDRRRRGRRAALVTAAAATLMSLLIGTAPTSLAQIRQDLIDRGVLVSVDGVLELGIPLMRRFVLDQE